jgi:hypothetical protein
MKFNESGWEEAPLTGEASIGTPGTGGAVVKLHTPDQVLVDVPAAALTRQ